jgi:hypothetical protein
MHARRNQMLIDANSEHKKWKLKIDPYFNYSVELQQSNHFLNQPLLEKSQRTIQAFQHYIQLMMYIFLHNILISAHICRYIQILEDLKMHCNICY